MRQSNLVDGTRMFDILPAQMLRPKRAATGPIDK